MTEDLGLSAADVETFEKALSDLNHELVGKSGILKHLKDNLADISSVVSAEGGDIDISPVARKLRDLSKGVDVSFTATGSQSFPLTRHGMGTRSLASLLGHPCWCSGPSPHGRPSRLRRRGTMCIPSSPLRSPRPISTRRPKDRSSHR